MTMKSVMLNKNFLTSKDSLNTHGVSKSTEQKALSFFSMIRDAVQPGTISGDAPVSKEQSRLLIKPENTTSDVVESTQSPLERVRRAFLAKGVDPDQVVLDQNDFKSLGLILDKLGFSQDSIDSFFQDSVESYSGKEMTLSDFFRDFTQFETNLKSTSPSNQVAAKIISLDKSSIPQIESALRDLGVTPEALDSLLPSVIDENGDVNMKKLTHELKKMQSEPVSPTSGETGIENNSVLTHKLVEALEIMELSTPNQSIGEAFSMDDLIGLMDAKVLGADADVQESDDQSSVVLGAVAEISTEEVVENERINTFFAFAKEMMALQNFEKSYLGNTRSPLIGSRSIYNTNDIDGGIQKTVVAAKAGVISPVISDSNGTTQPDISDVRLENHVETTTKFDIRNIQSDNRVGQPITSSDKTSPALTPAAGTAPALTPAAGAAVEMSESGANLQGSGAVTANAAIAPGVEDLSSKVASSNASDIRIDRPVDSPIPHVNTHVAGQAVASSDKTSPALTPSDISMEKESIVSDYKVMEVVLPDQLMNPKDVLWGTNRFRKNIDSTFSLPWGKSDTSGGAQMIAAINGAVTDGNGGVSKEVDGLIDDILLNFGNRMENMDKQGLHKNSYAETSVASEKILMAGQGNTSATETLKQESTLSETRLPSNVLENVGKEIASFLQRGDRILKIQLKPVELGTVTIEMDTKENVLKLSIVAETSSAKEMFLANHSDLRRILEGHGVKLETLDVQTNSNFDQSLANGSHDSSRQNQRWGSRFARMGTVDDDEVQHVQSMGVNKDALLDLLV